MSLHSPDQTNHMLNVGFRHFQKNMTWYRSVTILSRPDMNQVDIDGKLVISMTRIYLINTAQYISAYQAIGIESPGL